MAANLGGCMDAARRRILFFAKQTKQSAGASSAGGFLFG
jgi:hypothetical protein